MPLYNPPQTPLSVTTKGDIQTFSTTPARLAVGTDGQILESRASETTGLKWINPSSGGSNSLFQQAIINGNFDVWQRDTTFTTPNDDTYGPDRWNFLMDGNGAWTFSRSLVDSDNCPNSTYELKAVNVTANKQCGIVQILESINSMKLSNKDLTISFRARTTTGKVISNLRTTLLSWEGTADSVTSDVIGAWAGGGTVPTWAANWSQFDTTSPPLMGLTTDSQRFSFTVGLGPQGFNNLALVIWTDDTSITAGDEFYITEVQLCAGDVALPFMPKSYEEELIACQRYFKRFGGTVAYERLPIINIGTSTTTTYFTMLTSTMRIAPIVTLNGSRGTDWILYSVAGSANTTGTFFSNNNYSSNNCVTFGFGSGTFTAGTMHYVELQSTSGSIDASAEL